MRNTRKIIIMIIVVALVFSCLFFSGVFYQKTYGQVQEFQQDGHASSVLSYMKIGLNDISITNPVIQYKYGKCGPSYHTTWVEPALTEVAEPLEGKELYIFYIAQIHEQYYPDVDPYVALAVLEVESNYNPNVQSKAGAVGLMQVIPKYHLRRAEPYGLNDIWDPYTNILCGMDFLNDLYWAYGSWERGLMGYNNSRTYVNYVLSKADILRGGNYFGETTSPDTGSS